MEFSSSCIVFKKCDSNVMFGKMFGELKAEVQPEIRAPLREELGCVYCECWKEL